MLRSSRKVSAPWHICEHFQISREVSASRQTCEHFSGLKRQLLHHDTLVNFFRSPEKSAHRDFVNRFQIPNKWVHHDTVVNLFQILRQRSGHETSVNMFADLRKVSASWGICEHFSDIKHTVQHDAVVNISRSEDKSVHPGFCANVSHLKRSRCIMTNCEQFSDLKENSIRIPCPHLPRHASLNFPSLSNHLPQWNTSQQLTRKGPTHQKKLKTPHGFLFFCLWSLPTRSLPNSSLSTWSLQNRVCPFGICAGSFEPLNPRRRHWIA